MENKPLNTDNEKINEVVYKPLTYAKQELLVPEKKSRKKETFFLYFTALTVDIIPYAAGCCFIWSSPAIPKLRSTDPNINPLGTPITPFQESWIAALPALGATIGPLLTGKLADTYGRKNSLLALALLQLISFVGLAFATNMYIIYLTRFFLGVGVGISYAILPSYTGEICEDHNRGKFGCIIGIFLTLGVLYTVAVGPLLPLKLFTLSCAAPLVFVIICLVLVIPETPFFLATVGKTKEAQRVLMKLRNKSEEAAEKDLLEILQMIEEMSKSSKGGYLDLVKTLTLRKALLISMTLFGLQQFSGVNAILAFIEPIFDLTGSKMSSYVSSIIVISVKLLGIFLAAGVVERLGRKYIMLVSALTCAIAHVILGLYFYLKDNKYDGIESIFWLPVTTIVVFVLAYNFGLGPVPWALLSEIFPPSVKATASSFATASCAFTAFLVTLFFPFLIEFLGAANCFCIFGGFCVLGAIFIYFAVPETKGKNFAEIQRMLSKTGN